MRRWSARGGDPDLVLEVALWSVLAGIIGARIYHDITSWDQLGDQWYAPFAIWEGGLGIWGGVAAGVRGRAPTWCTAAGASVLRFMDAAAPGAPDRAGHRAARQLLQPGALRRPARTCPGRLEVDGRYRPDDDPLTATFHPTFLYEMLWNFAGAALLIWIGRRFRIRPPGLFCLYVAIYSLGRIFWEQLRVDPSRMFLGQRLNFYVALVLLIGALAVFVWNQRREETPDRDAGLAAALAGRAREAGALQGAERRASPLVGDDHLERRRWRARARC